MRVHIEPQKREKENSVGHVLEPGLSRKRTYKIWCSLLVKRELQVIFEALFNDNQSLEHSYNYGFAS